MFLVGVDHWMKVLTSRVRKNKNTNILFALYRVAEKNEGGHIRRDPQMHQLGDADRMATAGESV